MIRALVDTNIVLDVLLDRRPHVGHASVLWANIEAGRIEGFLSAHTVTTIHYLLQRELGNAGAKKAIISLLSVFAVASVTDKVLEEAVRSPSEDFEDAVTAAAARQARCTFIVTRDLRGFRGAEVRVVGPEIVNAFPELN